ncbi:MAG: hypothetical protein HQK51_11685 [Oligoflexia bacterium]|nr:hypothetical protein [Oligoflexia bacterium]
MRHNEQRCLTGYLSPISWNKKDEIKSYSIFTDENEDVILTGAQLDKDFKVFKNQRVKIFGTFLKSQNDARVFEVKKTNPMKYGYYSKK